MCVCMFVSGMMSCHSIVLSSKPPMKRNIYARKGNVFIGLCHSVQNQPHGYSFTAHHCYGAVGTHPTRMLFCLYLILNNSTLKSLSLADLRGMQFFMQFSAKILPNNRFLPQTQGLAHPLLGNPGSATEYIY